MYTAHFELFRIYTALKHFDLFIYIRYNMLSTQLYCLSSDI